MNQENMLELQGVDKYFPVEEGKLFGKPQTFIRAVDHVSFSVKKGEVVGLVGESGCGKTSISRCILGLEKPTEGKIFFKGQELSRLKRAERKKMCAKIQMIFQDPYSSLNPRMKVGDTISESLKIHHRGNKAERERRVAEMLQIVGLDPAFAKRYPHEFSGGQRQRIGIARVLAINPEFIICDEPVSALDVSIRSQVLNILNDLKATYDLTMLFISHDLSVVEYLCDRIMVMYMGHMVEVATKEQLYRKPKHPYTQALLSAIPTTELDAVSNRIILSGEMPNPAKAPKGCRFCTRCRFAKSVCSDTPPKMTEVKGEEGHMVACHMLNNPAFLTE